MSSNVSVSEDVEDFVRDIIAKHNLQGISDIKYEAGSQIGDGYGSKTYAVNIVTGKEPFHVFLKCFLKLKSTEAMPVEKLYTTEIYFYDVLFPAYLKFLDERGSEDGFRNVPKCYGTSPKNMIALENLRDKGFVLFDRRQTMNESHLVLALKTYAKFHAISFAYKDQKREEYDKFLDNTFDFFSNAWKIPGFDKLIENLIGGVAAKLDPVKDKHILDKFDGLSSKLCESMISAEKSLNEYSVITQGDSWCNNMMFLYEEKDKKNPIDVMLFDWQIFRPASPVFDICYFFYTIASKEALDNLQYYLRVYHEELSKQIRQLGSDPEVLYPFEVLNSEWKQHGKYGFGMAFNMIKLMLSANEDIINMEDVDFNNTEQIENLSPKLKNEDHYIDRMKALANHMIKNDYL